MNWYTVALIIILLVGADKLLTLINIKLVEKNNPGVNPIDIEKNPAAKFFFQKFGVYLGTLLFFLLTCCTFAFALWMLHYATSIWAPNNSYGVALYVMTMGYGLVIANNFYFMFSFGGWLQ